MYLNTDEKLPSITRLASVMIIPVFITFIVGALFLCYWWDLRLAVMTTIQRWIILNGGF